MSQPLCHLGVDVSKATLDLHHLGKSWQVPNSSLGFRKLIAYLKKHPARVVCEASGPYHLPLVLALQKVHLEVCVVNPRQVRDFAKSRGILAKTDILDARVLTLYADSCPPRATAALPPEQLLLAAWVDRRQQLVAQHTAESNRTEPSLPPDVLKHLRAHLRFIERQIALVEKKIQQLLAASPQLKQKVQRLQSVRGVGPATALAVMAALPELGSLNQGSGRCTHRHGSPQSRQRNTQGQADHLGGQVQSSHRSLYGRLLRQQVQPRSQTPLPTPQIKGQAPQGRPYRSHAKARHSSQRPS